MLTVKNAINVALNKSGTKSVEVVKDIEKFVKNVQSNLSDDYPDTNNFSDEIGNDEAAKKIDDIYDEVKDAKDNNIVFIAFVCVAVIVLIVGLIFASSRKRKRKVKG